MKKTPRITRGDGADHGKLGGVHGQTNHSGNWSIPMEYPQCLKSNVGHIGEEPIMCAVLQHADRTIQRVLERRQMFALVGWSNPRPDTDVFLSRLGAVKLPDFLASENLRPFVDKYLQVQTNFSGFYRGSSGQRTSFYDYRVLTDTCRIWIAAEVTGVLRDNQKHIARKCQIIGLHFMQEGLRDWIDSVTGFVDAESIQDRTKRLLLDDPRDWEVCYPRGFWLVLERLHGYGHIPGLPPQNHPFGHFLLRYIYSVLDDHTVSEMQERSPYEDKERRIRIHKLHQLLNDEALAIVVKRRDQIWDLARTSKDLRDFKERFECLQTTAQLRLDFHDSEGRPTTFVIEHLAGTLA